MTFDLLIHSGRLIDGTSAPWRYADLGIVGGQVVAIGPLDPAAARQSIDASNCFVCPGFIDLHSHADIALLSGEWMDFRLRQGITTEVVGQDGLGYAPANPANLDAWRRYLSGLNGDLPGVAWDWQTVGELLQRYQNRASNAVFLVPHGPVRVEVMGWAPRPAAAEELNAMQKLVQQGLEQGAAGISTGLSYIPCTHATTDEMVALCRPVAIAGGILSIHMRSYIADLMPALLEAIEIGRRSGVAVQLSHLRMCDPLTWHCAEPVLEALDKARAQGVDITFDIYPYTAGCAPLLAMLPPWAQSGGPDAIMARLIHPQERQQIIREMQAWSTDWPAFILSSAPPNRLGDWAGVSLAEAAERSDLGVEDFILQILKETGLNAAIVADGGNEADNDLMFAHPAAMVCSDGILPGQFPHPRGYGAFPRVLAHYVREKHILRWEEAVHKMSGAPAARLNLQDRGLVKVGAAADLVVFDPDQVSDRATLQNGRVPPAGIRWVLVNGQVVVAQERYLGKNPGRALTPLQIRWSERHDSQ